MSRSTVHAAESALHDIAAGLYSFLDSCNTGVIQWWCVIITISLWCWAEQHSM